MVVDSGFLHPGHFLIPLLKLFGTRGAFGGGSLGLAHFLLTTVVSTIVSDVKWWSSKAIWGDTVASSRKCL